jgi:archaeal flagellar protein FlaF
MAVADLIGAVVGVLLLVIVAYLLVGSTLTTAEIVTSAQRSAAMQEQTQMRTDFTITDVNRENDSVFNCTINNTGKEIISDFSHMDVLVYDSNINDYQLYAYSKVVKPGTWTIIDQGTDVIHHSELDPGESYRIEVTTSGISPYWFQITTGNGVYASKFL